MKIGIITVLYFVLALYAVTGFLGDFGLGTCVAVLAGYLALRLAWCLGRNLLIRLHIRRVREENRALLVAQTDRLFLEVEQCGLTREELKEVAELPWPDLVDQLQSGQMTAVTALTAYQAAALEVAGRTNCVTEWLEDALEEARRLDSLPADSRGPLHGVPISVKECYELAGTFATAGMTLLARNKAEVDCPLVEMMRRLGGVPFCKTNVPQCMLSLQCSNPIYGTSTNPHSQPGNPRECGGSSGGEGVLVGSGASILGLGSDIGGSLRAPAAFCGGYTLKPTEGRHLSKLGSVSCVSPVGFKSVGGFMTRSAVALEHCWRVIWQLEEEMNTQRNDPSIIPPRWDEELYAKKPKIGYFTSNGLLEAAPGCVRVVKETVDNLEAAGYDVVEVNPPDMGDVLYYYVGMMLAEENQKLYKDLSSDVYDSCNHGLVLAVTLYKLPWILKKLVINPLLGLLTRVPPIEKLFTSTLEFGQAARERDELVRSYLTFLHSAGVDVIICPGQQLPAPQTGRLGTMMAGISPYIAWNVMNFPAGIATVSTWSSADTVEMENYPRDDILYKMIRSCCEGAEGMPLSVQVVGKPFKDEQVLRVLSNIEQILKKKKERD